MLDHNSLAYDEKFSLLEKKLKNKNCTPPILPINFATLSTDTYLFTVDPIEIAKQMTLYEYQIYHAIQPKELLGNIY